MSDEKERLLNTRAAADFLGISYWWLVKARRGGRGPKYIKIGRAIRYSKVDLFDFINKNKYSQ
jgi:predicted DNA-binding transcriptional regulator AlpA